MSRVRVVQSPALAFADALQGATILAVGILAGWLLDWWVWPVFLVMFAVTRYRRLRQSPPLVDQIRRAYQDRQGAAGRHATYRVTPLGGPEDDQQQG